MHVFSSLPLKSKILLVAALALVAGEIFLVAAGMASAAILFAFIFAVCAAAARYAVFCINDTNKTVSAMAALGSRKRYYLFACLESSAKNLQQLDFLTS